MGQRFSISDLAKNFVQIDIKPQYYWKVQLYINI